MFLGSGFWAQEPTVRPASGRHLQGMLGAFLPTIDPDRRIGDYVHATARIANIPLSRLEGENAALTSVVVVPFPLRHPKFLSKIELGGDLEPLTRLI